MSSKQHEYLSYVFPKSHVFWKYLALILGYSLAVFFVDDNYFPKQKFLEADSYMITTGIVIGLLFVFRTNSAYQRWWEGRVLWGQLVNELRNLRIKIELFMNEDSVDKEELRRLFVSFPYALKEHLRGQKVLVSVTDIDSHLDKIEHLPFHIAGLAYAYIFRLKTDNKIDGFQFLALDQHLRGLMDVCGSCERIKNTPIAASYKSIIWIWIAMYFLIVPWLLVPTFDYWSLLIIFIGAYFVLALELLAEEVEEPFGTEPNDLPLDSICKTIEASITTMPAFAIASK